MYCIIFSEPFDTFEEQIKIVCHHKNRRLAGSFLQGDYDGDCSASVRTAYFEQVGVTVDFYASECSPI